MGPAPVPTVLVVDDEPAYRLFFRGVLEGEGYEVVEAESGQEALHSVHRREFFLVLLDAFMTGMSGLEALRRIQALRPGQRVVMLSVADWLVRHEAAELSCPCAPKPTDPDDLLSLVTRHTRDA